MKKRATRIISLLIAIVLIGGFIYYQRYGLPFGEQAASTGESTESAPPSGPPGAAQAIPVKAMRINAAPLQESISVNGSTVPNEEVTISSEVPGKISEVLFTEGTWVEKGKALVQLDVDELNAQRERLVVQKNLNEKIAERLKGLYEKEGVSLQEYEVAKAEAEKVKADIDLIDVQIEKRTIRAPFSGRLGLKEVSEGSFLSPGAPIVNLVSTNPIKLEFSVPEKYSRILGQGSKVNFTLDGIEQPLTATVIASEPSIDPETRTFLLKATAPNSNGRILPGAFANVTVNLSEVQTAIMVPTEAIVPEMGGKKVYLFKGGKAQAVPVETGVRQASMVQVTGGLEPGDTVITTGVLQIRPGAAVDITTLE